MGAPGRPGHIAPRVYSTSQLNQKEAPVLSSAFNKPTGKVCQRKPLCRAPGCGCGCGFPSLQFKELTHHTLSEQKQRGYSTRENGAEILARTESQRVFSRKRNCTLVDISATPETRG